MKAALSLLIRMHLKAVANNKNLRTRQTMRNRRGNHFSGWFLLFVAACSLTACHKSEPQHFDTFLISGQVIDINTGGIPNVTIYIDTGRYQIPFDFDGSIHFGRYDSTVTDYQGKYSYHVKGQTVSYIYQVCCKTPSGYTRLDDVCKPLDAPGGGFLSSIDFSFIR